MLQKSFNRSFLHAKEVVGVSLILSKIKISTSISPRRPFIHNCIPTTYGSTTDASSPEFLLILLKYKYVGLFLVCQTIKYNLWKKKIFITALQNRHI